mmetsp:Transcript_3008/g.7231  ORF Transcript_3008/g.7231 Transcript_3008/m.7231 type:complete len:121 (+) Transcript_3008:779-1141(+)
MRSGSGRGRLGQSGKFGFSGRNLAMPCRRAQVGGPDSVLLPPGATKAAPADGATAQVGIAIGARNLFFSPRLEKVREGQGSWLRVCAAATRVRRRAARIIPARRRKCWGWSMGQSLFPPL